MPLTDTKVRQAKIKDRPYRLPDGNGLYLDVRPTGAKFWRWRFELPPGKESIYSIGEYPAVSLADARREREWAREQVKAGLHPSDARKARKQQETTHKAITFGMLAEEWIEATVGNWGGRHAKKVRAVLDSDILPEIGEKPIRDVSAADVLAMLRKIESRGALTVAVMARQWCGAVFRYAVASLRADGDPTVALQGALKRRPVRHHPHLAKEQIPGLLQTMQRYGGYRPTVIAMRLLLLTFVRTGELRQAEWAEFDLDAAEWKIPAHRMKMGRTHLVPLSTQSIALLQELHTITGGQKFLFPNLRAGGTCMSITTINRALERMGFGGQFSGHGFRGTASTALHEMGYLTDHIEAQLAHIDANGVRRAYNHAQYLPERRRMMQDWADFIDSLSGAGGHAVAPAPPW